MLNRNHRVWSTSVTELALNHLQVIHKVFFTRTTQKYQTDICMISLPRSNTPVTWKWLACFRKKHEKLYVTLKHSHCVAAHLPHRPFRMKAKQASWNARMRSTQRDFAGQPHGCGLLLQLFNTKAGLRPSPANLPSTQERDGCIIAYETGSERKISASHYVSDCCCYRPAPNFLYRITRGSIKSGERKAVKAIKRDESLSQCAR